MITITTLWTTLSHIRIWSAKLWICSMKTIHDSFKTFLTTKNIQSTLFINQKRKSLKNFVNTVYCDRGERSRSETGGQRSMRVGGPDDHCRQTAPNPDVVFRSLTLPSLRDMSEDLDMCFVAGQTGMTFSWNRRRDVRDCDRSLRGKLDRAFRYGFFSVLYSRYWIVCAIEIVSWMLLIGLRNCRVWEWVSSEIMRCSCLVSICEVNGIFKMYFYGKYVFGLSYYFMTGLNELIVLNFFY